MEKEFNIPTVLIAPLDWGLGHVTRCIPIIKAFKQLNWNVIIATNETGKIVLQQEFAELGIVYLKGYNIKYAVNPQNFMLKIIAQVPKIIAAIKFEHQWLQRFLQHQKVDLIISDNRFGFYSPRIKSIFITHQLQIKTPFKWLDALVQKVNYSYINRFTNCWVVDVNSTKNAAGVLSHPVKPPAINTEYLGLLSRFEWRQTTGEKYNYCIVISGPEPQRTFLEKLILKDIEKLKGNVLLVRGKPKAGEQIKAAGNIVIENHLTGNRLQQALEQSEYIIARSGYTTVMEILSLRKKSILIPTPGQTEQEYLAEKLQQQHLCFCVQQNNFNLADVMQQAAGFNYSNISFPVFNQQKLQQLLSNV